MIHALGPGELEHVWCGRRDYHDAHDSWSVGFVSLVRRATWCEGIRDQVLIVTELFQWTQVRDEIIPALARQFPGCIVEGDERIVESSIPKPRWRGASLTVLGLEPRSAAHVANALRREFGVQLDDSTEIRNVTDEEAARVDEHRRALGLTMSPAEPHTEG